MLQPPQPLPEEYIGQPPNEFVPMAGAEFIPRPEYVNHNAPHMVSPIPVFNQQEDGTFQTFPAEFIPAAVTAGVGPAAPIQTVEASVEYLPPQLSPAAPNQPVSISNRSRRSTT